ncbi:hypothetical protein INT47_011170 [Mucor saturninus]|uniref:DNA replication regulator SLD2 n=1 Tax=Mucor saturninus TaxID=64648 RepID=A0A8H7V7I1_9FUNG|nr:hypothetical protein INT47_011170 [Mucor saturninus]
MDIKALQRKVFKTKKDLKDWEAVFAKKHGRPPTVQDVSDRPNIEKVYKKYNQLKKTLKQELEAGLFTSSVSPPDTTTSSHQTSNASSPDRRPNVEFVASPRPSPPPPSSSSNKKMLAEDEAFWLGVPPTSQSEFTSFSQPITTSFNFTETEIPRMSSTQQPSRLILGSSQTKRKIKQSFGRNPFQRATEKATTTSFGSSQPQQQKQQQKQSQEQQPLDMETDDEDEHIQIVNHEVNPFRNYDPSLFQWEDPSFSVGPGFFAKASSCYLLPMLNEPSRRDRVLRKLEKGTLGEVLPENQSMEEDLDEDMRQFITQHSQLDPNSFESAIADIDQELLNSSSYVYKKKPLQKRQTKLFKMKFVETH